MDYPANLKFTKSHEWVKKEEGGTYKVGLTDYAQQEMGDIVFVSLPCVGDDIIVGESFADIESVKAVEDIYSPLTGLIIAINTELLDNPAIVNTDCYDAWFVEADEVVAKDEMLTADEYEAFVNKEA